LKWNEENVLPYELRNKSEVIKVSSFTKVLNGFEIMAIKLMPYFKGDDCDINKDKRKIMIVMLIKIREKPLP
jgi:hypothetical protein